MDSTASPQSPPETIGAFQAKTELSRVLRQVRAGKSFIITQRGRPIAEIRPLDKKAKPARWGDMKGKIQMSDDFCHPVDVMRDYMP